MNVPTKTEFLQPSLVLFIVLSKFSVKTKNQNFLSLLYQISLSNLHQVLLSPELSPLFFKCPSIIKMIYSRSSRQSWKLSLLSLREILINLINELSILRLQTFIKVSLPSTTTFSSSTMKTTLLPQDLGTTIKSFLWSRFSRKER